MKKIAIIFGVMGLVACGIPQSPECAKYVECQKAVDDETGTPTSSLDDTYGEGGTCWTNAETADSCTTACGNAVDSLATAYPDIAACGE